MLPLFRSVMTDAVDGSLASKLEHDDSTTDPEVQQFLEPNSRRSGRQPCVWGLVAILLIAALGAMHRQVNATSDASRHSLSVVPSKPFKNRTLQLRESCVKPTGGLCKDVACAGSDSGATSCVDGKCVCANELCYINGHCISPLAGKCNGLGKDPTAVRVVTFNTFWWCVSDRYGNCPENAQGKGFQKLYTTIQANAPFDLVAFQECDNVKQVLDNAGYWWCLEAFDAGDDAPIAWNKEKFGWISSGQIVVARDKWGDRRINWVRLAIRATGGTLFFANTHGPVEQCHGDNGTRVATNYLNAIKAHKKSNDAFIFAGDFNCPIWSSMIGRLQADFELDGTDSSYNGCDHIFSNGLPVLWKGSVEGSPSDHQLLKVTLRLPKLGDEQHV